LLIAQYARLIVYPAQAHLIIVIYAVVPFEILLLIVFARMVIMTFPNLNV
jgi:hypothetical protein